MIARKPILLLTFLLAWLGGVNSVWAVSQTGENAYVKYLQGDQGFNIQFKYNGDWRQTTYANHGYRTFIEINGGDTKRINSGSFTFGEEYNVDEIVKVSIVASIDPARPWSVNIQYTIENLTSNKVDIRLGSCADTQVGDDDSADIERVGHNAIMMTAVHGNNIGAKYGITAGSDPFTTLWYGYYSWAQDKVFVDNGGVSGEGVYDGTSQDSGLAWSWSFELAGNATKVITCGGLAPAIKMAGYRYGETPSSPSITIEGNPTVTYYYNTSDSNTGGTAWSTVTSTSLAPGTYYMYAHVVPEGSQPYNTPTTPFRVAKANPQASDFAYTAPSALMYDGTQKTASVVTHLTGGKTGMGTVTLKYYKGTSELASAPIDAGTYIVKINVTDGTNYNSATGITAASWTFSITKRPITQTTITVADIAYNGNSHDTKPQVTVKVGDNTIPNTNYTVEPSSVTEGGTYILTIVGKTNLTGSTTKKLWVMKNMATYSDDIKISVSDEYNNIPIPTQIYDGTNPVNPTFYVYDKDRLLTPIVDYTFYYGAYSGEGTAAGSVTITGAGAYSGSKTFTFAVVNEYFTEESIDYHATSSTTVAVGNKTHTAAIPTTSTGIVIPPTVAHVVTFQVTDIEDGAFTGCSSLRYIDFSEGAGFTPSTLERDVAASPFYDVPKQALVYLNGTAVAGENYVYKVDADDYRCDEFKIYDDVNGSQTGFAGQDYKWAFENRYQFTAKSIVNTRRFEAGQHYTVCLPYDMTIPETFKAYQLVGTNTANSLIGFLEVAGNKLEGLKPYVIIPTESGQLLNATEEIVYEFKEERTDKMALTPTPGTSSLKMYGTLRYIDGASADGKYIMQSGNTWKQISGSQTYDGACILPMRAYISGGTSAARTYLSASFTDTEHNTTKVEQLRLDEDTDGAAIYDLQGRKVQIPQRKGVYIKNGRKVIR